MKRIHYQVAGCELTRQEAIIISLIVQGYRSKQISDLLGKNYNTYIHQLQSAFDKLNIHDCDLLATFASQHGFDDKGHFNNEDIFIGIQLHPLPKGADNKT